MMAAEASTQTPTRRPFTGSCHCKHTTYIAYLTLPHTPPDLSLPARGTQRFYRCNCTTCHKAGLFHVRFPSAPDDFLLLSPLDPMKQRPSDDDAQRGWDEVSTASGLRDAQGEVQPLSGPNSLQSYTCFEKQLHFLFCPRCGGRCFSFAGQSEVVEVDLTTLGLHDDAVKRLTEQFGGQKVQAWRPKKEGWFEGRSSRKEGDSQVCYLSVNAYSLDAGQEGLDLREWTDKKWVMYLDVLAMEGGARYEGPFAGGAY